MEAANGWLRRVNKPWTPKPRPANWPIKQSIPSPGARVALEEARRMLAEKRRVNHGNT
jgi:hypothetical protein